jgi:acyl-CoA synthetase (AMP-forming)/AMP-acid ligase II
MLRHPHRKAYTFLGEDGSEAGTLTFAEVDRRARAIAAHLQGAGRRGEPVLLVYAPGLEFLVGFIGCLYAGMIAVPVYPPDPTRLQKTMPRFRSVLADAGASAALATRDIATLAAAMTNAVPEAQGLRWIATDALEAPSPEDWEEPEIGDDDPAMLQYTSGSTSAPKGVVVTHRNLLHNQQLIRAVAQHGEHTVVVGWLPPYHDMGLIGILLQPLYSGGECIVMSPATFLKRPMTWLRAMSTYRGTTSAAPNFAYDLCCRKARPEDLAELDLSSWQVAFNGAEPIRADTLERFTETFAPCGFSREAFLPCYGLAEATLIVSGVPRGQQPTLLSVDSHELEQGRLALAADGAPGSRTLVSSGVPLGDMRVAIVDPETGAERRHGDVGEIWIQSPSVARGYWNKLEESAHAFGAVIPGELGAFLRSGDLGFLWEGQLYVVGRLKDLIIIRGRNLYPDDLERSVERASAAIRPGCVAAFGVEREDGEALVIAAEADPRKGSLDEARRAVRAAIAREHEVQVSDVVLLPPGTIFKTTSGKIQRSACWRAYRDGAWTNAKEPV